MVGTNAFASVERRLDSDRLSIGAADGNDLILEHKSVSGRHAEIRRARTGYLIRDLGSTNGTYINGQRIEGEQALHPGDEVRFGAARFAMVAGSKAPSAIAKALGSVFGLLMIAGLGFLSIQFVHNWENLEKLGPIAAPQSAAPISIATNATSGTAPVSSVAAPATPIAEAKPVAPAPPWLAAINDYRAAVNLPPVDEDPKLSDADLKHATYVVKNYEDKVSAGHLIGAEVHEEEKGNPYYTREGQDAGIQSDVNQLWGFERPTSPLWALNNWISGPFHRLWILNPQLQRVGYGELCEKKYCVAALNLGSAPAPAPGGVSTFAAPIEFPADKSITALNRFSGEWPTPLTGCAGYSFPAGLPATIELGTNVEAKLADYQITRDGHGVEACGIDAETQNPVSAEQERGRSVLRGLGAAIIIPRYPLSPGNYSVTATLNDHAYQWSFRVIADAGTGEGSMPMPTAAAGATGSSKKDELENALRGAYARLTKGDSEGRNDYEAEIKRAEAAVAARADAFKQQHAAAAANAEEVRKQAAMVASYEASTGMAAMHRSEMDRLGESAFPSGPSAPFAAGPDRWLNELNRYRSIVSEPPVVADPAVCDAALKHSNYIAINYPRPGKVGAEMHTEDPAKAGYTTEGAEAARGEVAPAWYLEAGPARTLPKMEPVFFLNGWLEAPFHRPSLLRADVRTAGFGETCAGIACAAVLDLPGAAKPGTPVTYAQPILFPPAKYPIALDELPSEWPNPLNACPNYAFPVGVPITVQLGENVDAKLGTYALRQDGKSIEACGFDASSYSSGNPVELDRARGTLKLNGEVVIVPRKLLVPGATYDVSATVNDHPYGWSFTVSK